MSHTRETNEGFFGFDSAFSDGYSEKKSWRSHRDSLSFDRSVARKPAVVAGGEGPCLKVFILYN